MTYPFRAKSDEEWFNYIERLVQQHDTDIKRLWKRVTQSPQENSGQAFGSNVLHVPSSSGTAPGSGTGFPGESGSP